MPDVTPYRTLPVDPEALSRAFVRLLAKKVGEKGLKAIRARAADPAYAERDPVSETTAVEPLIRQALAECGKPIPDDHDPMTLKAVPGPIDEGVRVMIDAALFWAKQDGFRVT